MMFIYIIPFEDAPFSNFENSEDRAGPSQRREELIIIDQDTLVTPKLRDRSLTPINKKGKKKDKKVVISMGGLILQRLIFHLMILSFLLLLSLTHKQKLLMLLSSLH